MKPESVNKQLESSFRINWSRPALTNYKGETLCYSDLARSIAKMHIAFSQYGIDRGDKVVICSRNQAHWAVCFLATMTYGAVPVPLLHEFKPGNIHYLVNHSDAKILFVERSIWDGLNAEDMPGLTAIIQMEDYTLLHLKDGIREPVRPLLEKWFEKRYPDGFGPKDIDYYEDSPEEMAIGCHVHFLNKVPSPKVIAEAFSEIRPNVVYAVPLIVEKIYKALARQISDPKELRRELISFFGGNFEEIIIGGAALNPEVERALRKLKFPFTVGYGMTECAPIITYSRWFRSRMLSCGTVAPNIDIRIDSSAPHLIPGELQVRGANVFLGYYKNPEATA